MVGKWCWRVDLEEQVFPVLSVLCRSSRCLHYTFDVCGVSWHGLSAEQESFHKACEHLMIETTDVRNGQRLAYFETSWPVISYMYARPKISTASAFAKCHDQISTKKYPFLQSLKRPPSHISIQNLRIPIPFIFLPFSAWKKYHCFVYMQLIETLLEGQRKFLFRFHCLNIKKCMPSTVSSGVA